MKNTFNNWRKWFQTMRGGNSSTRSGCCQPVKPPSTPIPTDPHRGSVQFVAPHTRGTERWASEQEDLVGPN